MKIDLTGEKELLINYINNGFETINIKNGFETVNIKQIIFDNLTKRIKIYISFSSYSIPFDYNDYKNWSRNKKIENIQKNFVN